MLNNIKTLKSDKGFTIVELLIVIVVIAILAAITIVAYNGIQTRARASAAEALASSIAKKVEMYNAEPTTTGYPQTLSALNTPTSASYYVEAASYTLLTTVPTTAPSTNAEKSIVFRRCGHSGSTTALTALPSAANTTGIQVGYWDGSIQYLNAGVTSGNGGSTGTYPIACFPTAS